MCGIVGYIGKESAKDYLLDGLEKLEYRGYDSAGISIIENGKITTIKSKGKLKNLRNVIGSIHFDANIGIGHTRWATHGEPSDVNSHPHISMDNKISVVHNGIIENYEEIKEDLLKKGYNFVSQTDTEIIPNLISELYNGNLLDAVIGATKRLEGSYALAVMSSYERDKLIAVKKDSPLIVGIKNDEYFIASDIPALLEYTKDVYVLNDGEFAVLQNSGVKIYDKNKNEKRREIYKINFDKTAAQKDGYKHFMLKEIYEQPRAIKDTLSKRVQPGKKIDFDGIDYNNFKDINRIVFVACGTAYHAGKAGAYLIEKLLRMNVDTDIASEFKYRNYVLDKNTLVVLISQSGETADTISALRYAKKENAKTLVITNTLGSTLSREADFVFYTHAGPEIAVASTKAYTTQLVALYIFALFLAEGKMSIPERIIESTKGELLKIPDKAEEFLKDTKTIEKIAQKISNCQHIFYIGRALDCVTALEGSLKFKEISYINSQTYAAGELKHGPIALIENGTPVIAVNTNEFLKSKTEANVRETIARGASVIGVVPIGFENTDAYDYIIKIPDTLEILSPLLAILPLQLLAYFVAVINGNDVDKPRNLAKSVTVE